MEIKSFIVDAFTSALFKGNQAAVCLLDTALEEHTMLLIAKEFGFSETAFIDQISEGTFSIRYFSPKMEIPLCGHATMASAKVLFEENSTLNQLVFHTHSGYTLEIERKDKEISMYFPVLGLADYSLSPEILEAIGIKQVQYCGYNKEHNIVLVEMGSSEELANLKPDFSTLRNCKTSINGVAVTAASASDIYDYEYRYFWPWSGTDEDPVTGAVQSFLVPYWTQKLNAFTLTAFQCSERTGEMRVELTQDKVIITSNAVIFSRGSIKL